MKTLLAVALYSICFQVLAVDIVIETSKGDIEVSLDAEKAPLSVKNFLEYIDADYYHGTLFHRTIKNFVIQAGGILPDMTQKPPFAPILNEATNGLSNLRGTISMARTNEIHSGSSHFFINTVDNIRLDHQPGNPEKYGYAVFGKVTLGMDIVDAIQNVTTHTVGDFADTPLDQIVINTIRRK